MKDKDVQLYNDWLQSAFRVNGGTWTQYKAIHGDKRWTFDIVLILLGIAGLLLVLSVTAARCMIVDPNGVPVIVIDGGDTTTDTVIYSAQNFDGSWHIRGYHGAKFFENDVDEVIEPKKNYFYDSIDMGQIKPYKRGIK